MIEVKHLTKRYGNHLAVDDISFSVEKGKIYGFLGPNGAGKSTTMNILTGCLAASGGSATINGFDIFEDSKKAKKCIGYLPEQPPVYLGRTVREYLSFVAEAKGVPKAELKSEIRRVMLDTGITEYENRLIRHMSKGYRQRVGIAEALVGDPEVIILDEPTVGLDPQQIVEIRELIRSLGGKHTVILSSHILSEVQSVCEKVIIIQHGKIVALDTPENLERLYAGSSTVEALLECGADKAKEILDRDISALADVTVTETEDGTLIVLESRGTEEKELLRKLFNEAVAEGVTLLRLTAEKPSLEDIFLKLTEGKTAEETENDAPETSDTAVTRPEGTDGAVIPPEAAAADGKEAPDESAL